MRQEDGPDGSGSPRPVKRFKRICISAAILGCLVFYFYPAWVDAIYSTQRETRSTLHISAEMRLKIIAGDSAAVKWLEQRVQSGKGSIPALLLLQSMTGETFGEVPNYCAVHAFCGNMSRRQMYSSKNRGFRALREQERQAVATYEAKRNSLTYDRLTNIDLQDLQSVRAAIERAWKERDGGRLHILLSEESQGTDFFYRVIRYLEWLKADEELSFRIEVQKEDADRVDIYVRVINESNPNEGPQGHGAYIFIFRNPKTQSYEVLL